MSDMTHSFVWHDSSTHSLTQFYEVNIHICDTAHSYVWHDSFMCVAWLIHTRDMTHPYVWHDSFICVTWLIHMCDMTHSYECQMHMCDMTHSYVWHDWFIRATWLIHIQLSTILQRAKRRRRRRKNRKARGPTWWACWAGHRHHTYQESPVFCQKSTIFCLWGSFECSALLLLKESCIVSKEQRSQIN